MNEYQLIFSVDGKHPMVVNLNWNSEAIPSEALGYLIGELVKKFLEKSEQLKADTV